MARFLAILAGVLVSIALIGLLITPQAPAHKKGATLVIIRGAVTKTIETKAPRGGWLLIRRIPRP